MAWDDIKIEQKKELFLKRSQVGVERQPSWTSEIDSLDALVKVAKSYTQKGDLIETPYEDFNLDLFESLCNAQYCFKDGGNWYDAEVVNSRFFYRIETLDSFLSKHINHFSNYSNKREGLIALDITESSNDQDVYKAICKRFIQENNWLDLGIFVTEFKSRRNISWWTDEFEFESEKMFPKLTEGIGLSTIHKWIVDFAFKVGLSSDWLTNQLLFLRLDKDKIDCKNFKVPCVVDAYTQPIFSPQLDKPLYGRAFDLATDVLPKTREFVVKNIPVEAIEFIPVSIDTGELNAINDQPRITKKLIEKLILNI